MEENTFASFRPISALNDSDPETLRNYYMENNLTPSTDMLKNYLGWPAETTVPASITEIKTSVKPQIDIGKLLGSTIFDSPIKPSTTTTATTTTGTPIVTGPPPKNVKEFVAKYGESAEKAAQASGISKDLLLAQVALETGWGKHTPGFNMGGIKPGSSWKGKTQVLTTKEFENGKYVVKPQTFRAYDSPEEGFKGYIDFLLTQKRYKGLQGITDPNQAAEFMGKSGYATDPNYTSSLKNVIKQIQNA
jgi:flagellar protein FlgJ